MPTSLLLLICATLTCSLASVFISLLTQGLEITFSIWAPSAGREIAPNTGANATKFSLWQPNPEN